MAERTRPPGGSAPPTKAPAQETARPKTLPPPRSSRPDAEEMRSDIPAPANSLDEVERAMSLLDGRHHDAVRAQRETHRALEAKRVAVEAEARAEAAAETRSTVLRTILAVVLVGALGGGGWFAQMRYRRAVAADTALAKLADPYVAHGWKTIERPLWKPRDRAELTVGADTCVLALASSSPGDGKLVVERPAGTLTATKSAAYCTCGEEHVVAHTAGNAEGGVTLLYEEARTLGGNGALPFLSPRPEALPVSDTCRVDALDGWLAARHGASPLNADALAAPVRDVFDKGSFKLAASAPPELPFAVVPASANACFVAMSTVPGEELTLRVPLGERPLHVVSGSALAMGWCAETAESVTVWRSGTGSIVVYRVDSQHIGGTLGLHDWAMNEKLGDIPLWVKPTELGWDASATLLVLGVAPADISIPANNRPVTSARVIALALGAGHVTPEPDDVDRYLCSPSLDTNPTGAVCVQSSPLAWHAKPGMPAGIAASPLPFWMDVMTHVEDHSGLAIELQLLTLARKLAKEGYEATARAGVLEEREGIEVVGRPGDDRIIAIGLLSSAPWVLPYTNDAAWSLSDAPHAIPITDGADLHLVSEPRVKVPPDVRRTVVFRHHAR